MLAGFYCYTRMQTNLFPEVLFPRITVIADAGQQPVDRMMTTVTKPLESAVKKVQGTTMVKSSTSRGSCVIDVYFQWGAGHLCPENAVGEPHQRDKRLPACRNGHIHRSDEPVALPGGLLDLLRLELDLRLENAEQTLHAICARATRAWVAPVSRVYA